MSSMGKRFFVWGGRCFQGVAILLMGLLIGCGDVQVDTNQPRSNENMGAVSGRICNSRGDAWLENAFVYTNLVSDSGIVCGTLGSHTDRDGYFLLDGVPSGEELSFYISGEGDVATFPASVTKGVLTIIPEPTCLEPVSLQVAVITGQYGSFSRVLTDVGVTAYAVVDGEDGSALRSFLGDIEGLAGYELICINAGAVEAGIMDDPALSQNLATYVKAGAGYSHRIGHMIS